MRSVALAHLSRRAMMYDHNFSRSICRFSSSAAASSAAKRLWIRFRDDVTAKVYSRAVNSSSAVVFGAGITFFAWVVMKKGSKHHKYMEDVLEYFGSTKSVQDILARFYPPIIHVLYRDVLVLQAMRKTGPFAPKPTVKDASAFLWGPKGIYVYGREGGSEVREEAK